MRTIRLQKREPHRSRLRWTQQVRDVRLILHADFLNADEATSKRETMIKILDAVLADLFRSRKKITPTALSAAQFYEAIAKIALAENAIMRDAQLDIIEGMQVRIPHRYLTLIDYVAEMTRQTRGQVLRSCIEFGLQSLSKIVEASQFAEKAKIRPVRGSDYTKKKCADPTTQPRR